MQIRYKTEIRHVKALRTESGPNMGWDKDATPVYTVHLQTYYTGRGQKCPQEVWRMKTRLIPTLFALVRVVLMDNYMTLLKFNLCLNTTAFGVVNASYL